MKFIGGIVNVFKMSCNKNLSKIPFYEKIKMMTQGPFVVESFVIVGSFDCDCNRLHFSIAFHLSQY
jgi:hypothetical protein